VTVAAAAWYRPRDFPRLPGLKGLAEVFHFGKFASGVYVFGQLGRGAPEMIIGRARDMVEVAYFSRASGLVEIFNRTVLRAVLPVCLPFFAHGRSRARLCGERLFDEHGAADGHRMAVTVLHDRSRLLSGAHRVWKLSGSPRCPWRRFFVWPAASN
jgi:hypothetical protein